MIKKVSSVLIVLIASLFLSGCGAKHAGIKDNRPLSLSTESSASLYEYCADDVAARSPDTGFYPLESPLDSLTARILLAQSAKHRITVQYFTFHGDRAGSILAKALIEAAARGVQVDVLIDDIALAYDDVSIAVFNNYDNITVRVFNPTNSRRALHYVEMGLYSDTVGRRMHNKSFTADNSMSVFGGRNIGDVYFGLDRENYFIDNDMLAVGPLVNQISNQFDYYFSNAYSVDFDLVAKTDKNDEEDWRAFEKLTQSKEFLLLKEAAQQSAFSEKFRAKQLPLYFGFAELFYDMPEKVSTDIADTKSHLKSKIPQQSWATKRFYMASPYFIPSEKMMQRFETMVERGVDVAILTNSLESSDQTTVYAYYAQMQQQLLEMGVRLFEIHPSAFEKELLNQSYNLPKSTPKPALHAKTIVIDDDIFAIGSANMDPRSRNLNTEMVAIIQNKDLNTYEAGVFQEMIAPENAYELSLVSDENEHVRIVWKATLQGEEKQFYNDGNASWWLRVKKSLSLWFPVRDLL
jgi:putative cardiolipin synthase